jgi:hypothetical protein
MVGLPDLVALFGGFNAPSYVDPRYAAPPVPGISVEQLAAPPGTEAGNYRAPYPMPPQMQSPATPQAGTASGRYVPLPPPRRPSVGAPMGSPTTPPTLASPVESPTSIAPGFDIGQSMPLQQSAGMMAPQEGNRPSIWDALSDIGAGTLQAGNQPYASVLGSLGAGFANFNQQEKARAAAALEHAAGLRKESREQATVDTQRIQAVHAHEDRIRQIDAALKAKNLDNYARVQLERQKHQNQLEIQKLKGEQAKAVAGIQGRSRSRTVELLQYMVDTGIAKDPKEAWAFANTAKTSPTARANAIARVMGVLQQSPDNMLKDTDELQRDAAGIVDGLVDEIGGQGVDANAETDAQPSALDQDPLGILNLD